jgi:hypothetical protein
MMRVDKNHQDMQHDQQFKLYSPAPKQMVEASGRTTISISRQVRA